MKLYTFSKCLLSAALSLLILTSCGTAPVPAPAPSLPSHAEAAVSPVQEIRFTDALAHEVVLTSWDRVISLYGSFAEAWILAGGVPIGVTDDAATERGLELGEGTAIVGTVKEPNLEDILALDSDFVILSADIAGQVALDEVLTEAAVPHAYFRVDTFAEYLSMLELFCTLTENLDAFERYGTAVQSQIEDVLAAVVGQSEPSVLLLRAYSTGIKAKGTDNIAGVILRDLGAHNLVEDGSVLEDISLEEILFADPDYIFVTTMGKEDAALAYLNDSFASNPAWASLTAVSEDHVIILPKELFHYKPNARWGESYETLARILYPQLAADIC